MALFEDTLNWDTDYNPDFIQPYTATIDFDERDRLGLPGIRRGERVYSFPGEKWRLMRLTIPSEGSEVILPWYHVSNYGRVISHIYKPTSKKARMGTRWGYDHECLIEGKLKFYSQRANPDDITSGYKLAMKVVHMGKLPPIWLDAECTKQTPASERQELDLMIHRVVADTWLPIYEIDPDVNPDMLAVEDIDGNPIPWSRWSKSSKIRWANAFEIDHVDQNGLNNRCYNPDGTLQLRRTTGQDNNRAALIERGGNHRNSRGNSIKIELQEQQPSPLMKLFNGNS